MDQVEGSVFDEDEFFDAQESFADIKPVSAAAAAAAAGIKYNQYDEVQPKEDPAPQGDSSGDSANQDTDAPNANSDPDEVGKPFKETGIVNV